MKKSRVNSARSSGENPMCMLATLAGVLLSTTSCSSNAGNGDTTSSNETESGAASDDEQSGSAQSSDSSTHDEGTPNSSGESGEEADEGEGDTGTGSELDEASDDNDDDDDDDGESTSSSTSSQSDESESTGGETTDATDTQDDTDGTDGTDDTNDATSSSSASESSDSDTTSDTDNDDPGYGREVLSWVPPYDVARGLRNLETNLGTHSPQNVLTHLALQFWRPTPSGALVYESGVGDGDVADFRALTDQYGILLMLTVYNNNQQNPGWDWSLARQAFDDARSEFVTALVDEVVRLGLDGVDVDLEGLNGHEEDREAFGVFIRELGAELHALDKQLTVDSFHSPCFNAPNMAWWEDWVGYVDHVHSMGYSQMYEANEQTFDDCPADPSAANEPFFKYSYHRAYGREAGFSDRVVSVGLPASNSWGGSDLESHLRDILELDDPASICIWDFSLSGSAWRQTDTWALVREIRDFE